MKSWSFRTTIYQKVGATFWIYLEWKSSLVTPLLVFKKGLLTQFFQHKPPWGGIFHELPWLAFSLPMHTIRSRFCMETYSTVISVGMMNRFLFGSSCGTSSRWRSLLFWSCDFYIARSSLRSWKQPRPTKNGHFRWCLLIGFFTLNNPKLFFIISAVKWLSILRV